MKFSKEQAMSVPRSVKRLFPQVEQVVEAKRPVKVSVTERDCAAGKRLQADECALAKAAKRQYRADGAVIGLTSSYIIKGKRAIRFETTDAIAREITSFDRHHDFAPGDYCLSAVRPSQRRGGRKPKRPHSGSRRVKRIIHKQTVRVRQMPKGGS